MARTRHGSSQAAIHFPQVAGIRTPPWLVRGEGIHQAGLDTVIAENDIAMQVPYPVAPVVRGPFVRNERGESARVIGLVCHLDDVVPRRAIARSAGIKALSEQHLGDRWTDLKHTPLRHCPTAL